MKYKSYRDFGDFDIILLFLHFEIINQREEMQRKVSVLLFLAVSVFALAQNVSTSVTKRNVLMEDFTGIKCGNCPDGHKYVEKLVLGHPNNVFPIAVHAGSYAKVTAVDQPDFITEEGKEINEYFDVESFGYPCGIVNRQDMGNAGLLESRSFWIASSRTITYDDAKVNVWCSSSYDKESRMISADIELYYTSDVDASSSALCVSLLQSNILGPQAGQDDGDEYVHNHVLRGMLTPVWGDVIEESSKGTLVKKHYEYTLPEVIGNVDTDPQNMSIVAYVIQNNDKLVLNVNGCDIDCPNMTLPTSVDFEAYKIIPTRNNAFPYLECYLVNKGTDAITTADFKLTIDDEDDYTCTWTASEGEGKEVVAGKSRGYVRVPVDWPASAIKLGCDYSMKLTSVNGKKCSSEAIKGSFGAMQSVNGDLTVKIKTDKFADDNTFRLLDVNGNQVAEYGPYAEGTAKEYEETIHFPEDGTYCFEVADAWGNGITSPRGYLKWYDAEGNLVAQNNDVSNWGYRIFFKLDSTAGIEDINSNPSPLTSHLYNLQGQRITSPRQGEIYIQNGKKSIKK